MSERVESASEWESEKDFDARAVYFCANRAVVDESNPQEVAYRARAQQIAKSLLVHSNPEVIHADR